MISKLTTILICLSCAFVGLRADVFAGSNFFVQWINTGVTTDFYVTSSLSADINATNAWIAIGFSLTNDTTDSNLVVCEYNPCNNSVNHYTTSSNSSEPPFLLDEANPSLGLLNTFVMPDDANLTCFFSRYNILLVDNYIPVDFNNTFVFFSFGGGEFSWNGDNETIFSSETVDFPLDNSTNVTGFTRPVTSLPTTMNASNIILTTLTDGMTTNATDGEEDTTTPAPAKPTIFQLILQIFSNIWHAIFGKK